MRLAWIMGWAVPEPWFAGLVGSAHPADEHAFLPSAPDAIERLARTGPYDAVVGYSLGALLLLQSATQVKAPVTLLAPFFAFCTEEALGGRTARTQVRYLARWMRRDALAAVTDFYARAGLDVTPQLAPKEATTDLLWGLERLERDRVEPPLPAGWRAVVGANDPLLDARRLAELDARIQVVSGATHHPAALIADARFLHPSEAP